MMLFGFLGVLSGRKLERLRDFIRPLEHGHPFGIPVDFFLQTSEVVIFFLFLPSVV